MTRNNERFDLSNSLIHFFRAVDMESDSSPPVPENLGFNNVVEDTKLSALFLLRCAVRNHRLWATWSVRGGERTIYGRRPAVCFTEMPLAAFLEAGTVREDAGQAMSPYALVFPKESMFRKGARPVIYGLSDPVAGMPPKNGGGPRIIDRKLLPLNEQYRYVTYRPITPYKVDWTHEREWRWPFTGDANKVARELKKYGVISHTKDIPAINFSEATLAGIGIIVKTKSEAKQLAYDVLTLIDQGLVRRHHFRYVLVRDMLPSPAELHEPSTVNAAISKALLDFDEYFDLRDAEVEEILNDFVSIARSVDATTRWVQLGEQGGCWLWFRDNTHTYVRALIQAGRVSVNRHGHYLASLPEFDEARDLAQREEMATELAAKLKDLYEIDSSYYIVRGSNDADAIPFFVEDALDNKLVYNMAS